MWDLDLCDEGLAPQKGQIYVKEIERGESQN